MTRFSMLGFGFVLFTVGCSGSATVKVKTPEVVVKIKKPRIEVEEVPVVQVAETFVAKDLAEECMIKLKDVVKTPKFDYDEFDLLKDDREVLDSVGTCVVSGPLAGRSIQLIGRADPRGTQEYNLGLGEKRANTIATYLKRIGVDAKQIVITSRGDLDADGREENSWRMDRRVDLQLMEDINKATP